MVKYAIWGDSEKFDSGVNSKEDKLKTAFRL